MLDILRCYCQREYGNHSLRFSTKIQVYRAVVVPILLYSAETWVLYRKQIRLLERFHQRYLRSILGIKWQDHVSNEEVLKRTSLPSVESILLQVQLHWAGHVTRMEDVCMPKAIFFQRSPRRKARSWCSKKALQRSAEETACTSGNQLSVRAEGGLRPRQLALISEKSQLSVRGREVRSRKAKTQEAERASSIPIILSPTPRLSKVQ